MFDFSTFKINQHIAFQDAMIKNQIHFKTPATDRNQILSANKCKSSS